MLTSLQVARSSAAARSSTSIRCPRRGWTRFKHPQAVRSTCSARARSSPTSSCKCASTATCALLKGIMKEMLEAEDAAAGRRARPRVHREHTHGFEEFARALRRDALGRDRRGERRLARTDARGRAGLHRRPKRMIVCWAMGLTQHKNAVANIQEIVNLLLLRGQIGQARRGRVPGARPLERAGRPHDGNLGAPAASSSTPRRASSTSSRRDATASTRSRAIQAMHDRQRESLLRARRQFSLGHARHGVHGRGSAPLPPDRARLDEAQPRAPRHGRAGADPAVPRAEPNDDVQTRGEQFVTVENSMGVVHTSRGALAPASPHLLSEPAIVARLARATLGASRRPSSGTGSTARLRPHPRAHRESDSGLRRLQPSRARARRVLPPEPRARGRLQDRDGQRELHRPRAAADTTSRPASF